MTELTWRSDMTVELDDFTGSDARIARIARVSTKGKAGEADAKADAGLINFLMRERHGSPFEHAVLSWYIEAPIFVWREFMRHRIASYNEESGRYRELEPVFYVPSEHRKLVQVGKAGRYEFREGTKDQRTEAVFGLMSTATVGYSNYRNALSEGVAREVARMNLPLHIYSSAFVTMNARALMNFLSLRTKREGAKFPSYPQREIEMVAEAMETAFAFHLPQTYKAFSDNGRVAP
ncbi:FAD-dependent thymidylate synthase [Micromonospora sp. NPDC049751]|uniref:FAD-dependent thymidylate synthase n=1 Tax=Micromonospora sp. NPDC049751 TaxID=3154837 RepID=UPI0033DD46FB